MATEFFNRIADELEGLADRVEASIDTLLSGGSSSESSSSSPPLSPPDDEPSNLHDDLYESGMPDLDSLSEQEIQDLIQQEMMINSPLEGIADGVMSDIMSRQDGPSTMMEHFQAFKSAITWSEPFILYLLAFQLVMFLVTIWVAQKDRPLKYRLPHMVLVAGLVRSAEWLNKLGREHWKSFATQNYFDKGGIFVLIMLCGPLVLDSLIMLLMYMIEAAQLLIVVKRREIKKKQAEKAGDKKASSSTKATNKTKRTKTEKQA
eukprot:Nitzschia sp. Nitz4//scaffold2_size372955//261702//262487//NITZ4_000452-RA/size372955-processed-gene-0.526-mRNA-1//-1//CDS//3329546865//5204//frame0